MTRLYVVRHAKAEEGAPDAARRLAPRGQKDARAMAQRLAKAGVRLAAVEHSGLVRARETAALLAEGVGAETVRERPGLLPWDDPAGLAGWLRGLGVDDERMVVSHQPFCGDLVGWLTGGQPPVMPTCAVACLEREGGSWALRWLATPGSP